MARKTKEIVMSGGRDDGKKFLVTEMPILQADKWAQKAMFAIAKSNVDMPLLSGNGGMLEMGRMALTAIGGIDPDVGGYLLDELLDCVQIVPSGGIPREIDAESDIEDIKTLMILRKEALMIHIDFLTDGSSQNSSK